MSNTRELKIVVPRIILGSVLHERYEKIPAEHPLKSSTQLLDIIKDTSPMGIEGLLFYLYNEEFVNVLNQIHKDYSHLYFSLILKHDKIDNIIALLKKLSFKPDILFLDYVITDSKDLTIVRKVKHVLRGYCKHLGLYTKEPIGTIPMYANFSSDLSIYLMPFNILGLGLQNRAITEMVVNSTEGIYVSVNPLATHRVEPKIGMEYISRHKMHGTLIELTDLDTMQQAIKYAKYYLESGDFLNIILEFEDLAEICEECGLGMERYYPPSGGSYFYCSNCQSSKTVSSTMIDYYKENREKMEKREEEQKQEDEPKQEE